MNQRDVSLRIMELIDRHPNHRTVDSVMRCKDGCARRVIEHMHAVDRAEVQGRIPKVPRGKPGL